MNLCSILIRKLPRTPLSIKYRLPLALQASQNYVRPSLSHSPFTAHPNSHPPFPPPYSMASKMASCIFCKIVKGEIPSFKLFESDKTLAFLDIGPLSKGHALVIPKHHGEKLTDIPDDQLTEILPIVKKLAQATGADQWNLLQNNGKLAHQEVGHVHFHMIPKPNAQEGLEIGWATQKIEMDVLKSLHEEIKGKM